MKVFNLKQTACDIVGAAAILSAYLVFRAIDAAACAGGWVVRKARLP